MTDKAVVTQRSAPRDSAAGFERERLAQLGFAVEYELPLGSLVRADEEQRTRLAERGFRVKALPDTNILGVGRYRIDIEREPPSVPDHLRIPDDLAATWRHHLVQVIAPPIEPWIREIEGRGIDVVEPISSYGLFVVGDPETVAGLEDLEFVAWTGPFQPAYRLDEDLTKRAGVIQNVSIGVYPADSGAIQSVTDLLETLDGNSVRTTLPKPGLHGEYATLIVEIPGEQLALLARLPNVRWLQDAPSQPLPAGEREVQIVAGNLNGLNEPTPGYQAWLSGLELSGDGVCIAICDFGVDANDQNNAIGHRDLRGRQLQFKNYTADPSITDVNGHGTHVASIALGNATTSQKESAAGDDFLWGLGVAPAAEFVNQNALVSPHWPLDLAELTGDAVTLGAQVMNNSWSDAGAVGYSANASLLDRLARDPDPATSDLEYLVIVAAAGNGGTAGPRSIWPPHEAKNVIVVGATLTNRLGLPDTGPAGAVYRRSSRGPAHDGRCLPTVVAPGAQVPGALSATSAVGAIAGTGTPDPATGKLHDPYAYWSGTSMAAPHVAGCCALLIEWWRQRHGNQNPSPALVKALLINGAVDLAGNSDGKGGTLAPIPNNDQGWGRVNLTNVLVQQPEFPGATRGPTIVVDQTHVFTSASGVFTRTVTPADPNRAMRVTLVWTDAPGSTDDDHALVNDLDLEVGELATGDVFLGNVFADGWSETGGDVDRTNNVECVYVQEPNGTYDIRVIPALMSRNAFPPYDNTARQDFALVIENAE